jgi:tyrosyl-tRNA synthetase
LEATEALYAKKSAADVAKSDNVPSANVSLAGCVGKPVFMVAAAAGMFKSNGEARRMAQQGGLSLGDVKIGIERIFAESDVTDGVAVLRAGKKNYFVLKFA